MAEESVSQIVRAWWRDLIGEDEMVDLKKKAPDAARQLREDPGFVELFLDQHLESIVYDIGRRMLGVDRALLRVGSTIGTASALRKQIEQDGKEMNFWTWMEHVPVIDVHIALPALSREQVLLAADFRDRQAASQVHNAGFLRLIAGKMKNGQQVKDVWNAEQLARLWSEIDVATTFSLNSIKGKQITRKQVTP